MKIVHVIASLGMGGAETLLAQLAGRQAEDGHDVVILTLLGDRKVAVPARVSVHSLASEGWMVYRGLRMIWGLASRLRALRPDVVHSHMLHSNLLVRLLRPLLGRARVINTVHAVFETDSRVFRLGYKLLDRFTDVTAFVSREAQERYVSEGLTPLNRSVVVHNGIECDHFQFDRSRRADVRAELGISDDVTVITAIGRLTEQKDYPNLLDAFAQVISSHPDVVLLIVGDGKLREDLQSFVRLQSWWPRVKFAGIRNDIPAILSASDMLVLASAWEGFGLVLAEAMACRVPVVSTDCGGTAEVVGDCGVLVPPRNPSELAHGIVTTLELSGEQRFSQVQRAMERIRQLFSIDAALERWYRVYGEQVAESDPLLAAESLPGSMSSGQKRDQSARH